MKNGENSLEAIILVGGKGTRLNSVVNDRPKPMAEVGGRPFLEWLIMALKNQGVQRIILCTGYLGHIVKNYFKDGKKWDLDIQYSHEIRPLGTAGAVRNALDLIDKNQFLVINGDSYCHFDIKKLLNFHIGKKASITMWLVNLEDCRRYGSVKIGKDGEILAFHEKSPILLSGLINAGIYLMTKDSVKDIPKGQIYSLETDLFPSLIGRGLYAVEGVLPFIDIGTPESFNNASTIILQEKIDSNFNL